MPGAMHSQDVILDKSGKRLLYCRTTEHFDGGMSAVLDVAPSGMPPTTPLYNYS